MSGSGPVNAFRAGALLAIAGCLALAMPLGLAGASVGVGVGAKAITLKRVAHPGFTYRMPNLYVVNTGTRRSTFAFTVRRYPPKPRGRDVPRSWIRFGRRSVTLRPKQAVNVKVSLRVPRRARPGRYASNLVAYLRVQRRGGTTAGVAAATALRFTVSRRRPRPRRRATAARLSQLGDSPIAALTARRPSLPRRAS